MSNVNKIIKYGIESEVDPLLDDGVSVYKIAEIISTNHQDNPELRNCSHMVPQRYKETREKDKINDIIEAGKDPTDVINKEFISKLNEIIERFKKWSDEAESLYEEAKTDGTLMERVKILKEIRDNIAQERKSLESLKQYGTRQQSNIYKSQKGAEF